jgi:hypothetical protein
MQKSLIVTVIVSGAFVAHSGGREPFACNDMPKLAGQVAISPWTFRTSPLSLGGTIVWISSILGGVWNHSLLSCSVHAGEASSITIGCPPIRLSSIYSSGCGARTATPAWVFASPFRTSGRGAIIRSQGWSGWRGSEVGFSSHDEVRRMAIRAKDGP